MFPLPQPRFFTEAQRQRQMRASIGRESRLLPEAEQQRLLFEGERGAGESRKRKGLTPTLIKGRLKPMLTGSTWQPQRPR